MPDEPQSCSFSGTLPGVVYGPAVPFLFPGSSTMPPDGVGKQEEETDDEEEEEEGTASMVHNYSISGAGGQELRKCCLP